MENPPQAKQPSRRTAMPVLPVVINTLMSIDLERDGQFEELVALARVEPGLAVRVLQIAALMYTAKGGDTLPKAMMRIGVREVEKLVSEQSSTRVFVPTQAAEKGLWLHSIQVALLSEALASELPALAVDPERAHLAGLLHDIGRLVYYDHSASAPSEIEASDYDSPETLLEAETTSFGHNHVEVGAIVCRRWALPEYVSATVRFHHSPMDRLLSVSEEHRRIIETVQFADEVSVYVMRKGATDSPAFRRRVNDYLDRQALFLRPAGVDSALAARLATSSLREASDAFATLNLGPAPRFAA